MILLSISMIDEPMDHEGNYVAMQDYGERCIYVGRLSKNYEKYGHLGRLSA